MPGTALYEYRQRFVAVMRKKGWTIEKNWSGKAQLFRGRVVINICWYGRDASFITTEEPVEKGRGWCGKRREEHTKGPEGHGWPEKWAEQLDERGRHWAGVLEEEEAHIAEIMAEAEAMGRGGAGI